MRRVAILFAAAVALALALPHVTEAQTPPATGVISGTVRNGTAGASMPPVQVQLITIPPSGPLSTQQTVTVDGRFSFDARADASLTYLLRTEYAGIPYLDQAPLLISPELPAIQRDLVVWETTDARPALRIEQTTVTVLSVERSTGRIQLQREDRVAHDGDRIWVGGPDGVTLRAPGPEGLLGVEAQQGFDGAPGVEGQSVTSTRPVRPGTTTFVATMVVGYDPVQDAYRLRVTAPLPTEAMEVWVPERFANDIDAEGARASSEERDGERWQVIRSTGAAREGGGIVVDIHGLSGLQPDNPLTSTRGAAFASALAVLTLVAGVVLLLRFRAPLTPSREPLH
jgi:hypothetical protein